MADPEKIRIMARLAMLEKHCGRQIRDAEDSFRIDRITNPVWLNALRMTALYLIGLTIWAVSHIDFLLGSFAGDALVPLIRRSGMFYLLLLAVTVGISLPISMMRCRKERGKADEYQKLLLQLSEMQGIPGWNMDGPVYEKVPYTGSGEKYDPDMDPSYEESGYDDFAFRGSDYRNTGYTDAGYTDTGYKNTGYTDTGYDDSEDDPDW